MNHCVIQTKSWTESVFWTTVRSPATIKEKLLAPKETLIKAGWCNISLYLVGSAWSMSGCLYEHRSNCEQRSLNRSFKYGRTTIVPGWWVVVCTSAEVTMNCVAQNGSFKHGRSTEWCLLCTSPVSEWLAQEFGQSMTSSLMSAPSQGFYLINALRLPSCDGIFFWPC